MNMSGETTPMSPESSAALEARAALKGYVANIGAEAMKGLIDKARESQEQGLKGLVVPSEDHSSSLSIGEDDVSLRMGDFGPYRVPMDTALAVIGEIREEEQTHRGHA